ncbi:hypothetical protein BDD12DRAFT_354382 [Trichophaea hybrida]|nr:hypothetical protein BDD12DRAFT_354382 [Trichophaea hybrida]
MSDDKIHHQSFTIDDLTARTVTIYPTRAAIVRDLQNVDIKPGRTEITINNLTPLADEHSIKVEGHGTSAIVTDMTVDLVPNRSVPSSSDISSESESESEDESLLQPAELTAATASIKQLESKIADLSHAQDSLVARTEYLKKSMDHNCANALGFPELKTYAEVRDGLFSELKQVRADLETEQTRLAAAKKTEGKLMRTFDRARRGPREARRQRRLARADRKAEKADQKLEVPSRVYRVRITIEYGSLPPETQSVVSNVAHGKPKAPTQDADDAEQLEKKGPYLRISYITGGASWTPHYDLRLDTTEQSGVLTYRANFTNRTGETWRDAKVTLSTSQNTFSGLEDKVPWMAAWNVSLTASSYNHQDGGLFSPMERQLREAQKATVSTERQTRALAASPSWNANAYRSASSVAASENLVLTNRRTESTARTTLSSTFFGGGGGGDSIKRKKSHKPQAIYEEPAFSPSESEEDMGFGLFNEKGGAGPPGGEPADTTTSSSARRRLRVATANTESHGMTTTYDLPGTRTITSSKLLRRHVITELSLPSIEFSHISVPKLRQAVFLKARIHNKSTVSFLRGKAGLTLDGSFLGSTTIPLCVPGNHVDVGLGVDESIQISYTRPSKKSSSQGLMMMKESVVNYYRSIRIHNVRSGPVRLLVLDQVPVSDDERLRIGILQPKGLRVENDSVAVGGKGEGGKLGAASLRKNGEIWWELNMHNGGDCVLPVEYEARMPQGVAIRVK